MMTDGLNVLVLGVGGNVSQGILKALAICNVKVRVIGACISPHALGLYTTDRSYVSPRADDPEFENWLIDVCERESIHAIFSGVEPVLDHLERFSVELFQRTGARSMVSSRRCLSVGNDKLRTCQWLEESGMCFPLYAAADDDSGLSSLLGAAGLPLIAKPRIGKGAQGISVIHSMRDLASFKGKLDYVIQEYVGDSESEYTAGCVSDRDGAVRGTIVMRRGLSSGTTVWAEVGDFPDVRASAIQIAEALRPLGPCNMQFRVAERGPVCFEINVRFSGTTPLRARFGFNEVEWVLRHLILDQPVVDLPVVSSGIALRYWNEMYVDPTAFQILCDDGRLDHPNDFASQLEDYGAR